MSPAPEKRSGVGRALRLVTEVRDDEGPLALALAVAMLFEHRRRVPSMDIARGLRQSPARNRVGGELFSLKVRRPGES